MVVLKRDNQQTYAHQWNVVVVIPARNEEKTISASIHSVLHAIESASRRIHRSKVVVVADHCSDSTVPIVTSTSRGNPSVYLVECNEGNVARARSVGVDVGRGLLGPYDSTTMWVASTDADTVVPDDWISRQLALADLRNEGVAGLVDVHEYPDLPDSAARHFTAHYTSKIPRTGSHPHVHAANLGFRLDAYDRAGGWGGLSRSEDRDLWTRLERTGASLIAAADLRVVTSGRGVGRVPGGFADWLREHVSARDEYETESAREMSR